MSGMSNLSDGTAAERAFGAGLLRFDEPGGDPDRCNLHRAYGHGGSAGTRPDVRTTT